MKRPLVLTVLALLVSFAPAAGQVPGYQQLDTRAIVAEYHAEVIAELNELMAAWDRAWANDDIDTLCDLYWESAVLIPMGEAPLRGEDALRAYFETVLPLVGSVEAFMLDFDASGSMATIYGNYMIERQTGPAAGTLIRGPIVTVYKKQGRTWRIRSQVFVGTERLAGS